MHIMIATPMYGAQCTAHYCYYNIELTKLSIKKNIPIRHEFIYTESLITRGRNALATTFLNSDCTHLMFIDADIGFNPEDVFRLLNHDKDIVCGGYPVKIIDYESLYRATMQGCPVNQLSNYASPYVYNRVPNTKIENGLIEVIEAGTGFMMIKKKVFDFLSDKVKSYESNQFGAGVGRQIKEFYKTEIEDGILLSEDYYFCRLWRKHGGKVFIDTNIVLQHIGPHVFQSSPKHYIR